MRDRNAKKDMRIQAFLSKSKRIVSGTIPLCQSINQSVECTVDSENVNQSINQTNDPTIHPSNFL